MGTAKNAKVRSYASGLPVRQGGGVQPLRHALGLLVVVEQHLVVLTPDVRFLVATKCCVHGVVVAVGPHAPDFDPGVGGGNARDLGVNLAMDGRAHLKVLPLGRRHPLAADAVFVVGLVLVQSAGLAGRQVVHARLLKGKWVQTNA